jgi:maltose phosphorylase
MAKEAKKYFIVNPWHVIEKGFDPAKGRVAESIFSLANEYMGVRGQFDETYTGDKLLGCYYNGVFEEKPIIYAEHFKGLSQRCCFMINANNWLYTRIKANGEELDLATAEIKDFVRALDMKKGVLTRSFIWRGIKLTFERFVSMECHQISGQKITFEPIIFSGKIELTSGIDFSPIHEEEGRNFWECCQKGAGYIECRTQHSKQSIYSAFRTNLKPTGQVFGGKLSACEYKFDLTQPVVFEKVVYNLVQRGEPNRANELLAKSYDAYKSGHIRYWENVWEALDVVIEGDEENQQGVRFCIFNLHQTYHGEDGRLNVGAKGLTGEKYSGWTFWDSETYCLPFYMFNNPKAARNLLMYRYNTLPQALERAVEQDCQGACYPMVTIDGTESCGVWQHGNLEIHVTAAVAYGVWHYVNNSGDREFLYDYGIELLLQTSRYFASRGGWSPKTREFGFWGVMGPDEFHMMVHNNTYTNYIVRKMFEYTVKVVEEMKQQVPEKLAHRRYAEKELLDWAVMAQKMRINFDPDTQLYEQHDGYFDLPEVNVSAIPANKVPVYKYWAYDSIFRGNMLKQPDVVLMQFFFSHDFSLESKRANYQFYEPRCSHESSLSPAIHSIMAAEIGNYEQAYDYARHGSRLDLDDYNRNVHQGLHVTSMAAAWMNVVYGFGGMRSDGPILSFKPTLPKKWKKYSFKLLHKHQMLTVTVESGQARFKLDSGEARILVNYQEHLVSAMETTVKTICARP